MTTNHRTRALLGIFVLGCGLGACTTQEAKTDAGAAGGRTGTGTGGSSAGLGGSGGSYATVDGVLCPLPTQALITDFGYMTGDAGTDAAVATDTVHFVAGPFSGGEFFYPTDGTWPLTSNVTGNNWHMMGTLGTYSGFGLFFDNCTHLDASAYKGISFTISGSVPMGSMITMGIGTLNNVIAASWLIAHPVVGTTPPVATAAGRCIPTAGTNQYDQQTCGDAIKTIPVTATPTTQTILWTDFTGGKPDLNGVHPSDIISMYWFFPPPVGAGGTTPTTYPADLVIDDLSFVP
jgi:hypothetical protein